MNLRNTMQRLALISVAVAAVCLGVSATAAPENAPASKTIRVLSVAGAMAASPQAAIWQKAQATEVALQPAFPGHVSIVGTAVTQRLTVQAVRAGDQLFVRLAWIDRTANTAIDDTNNFADGAAVQFPVNGQATTLPFMGDAKHAVNVWHWRADGRTQNLVAKGFGTATVVPYQGLKSAAVRTDGGWAVVFARPLRVKADEGANLQGRGIMPIAFAAWDGENQERDGLKAVTMECGGSFASERGAGVRLAPLPKAPLLLGRRYSVGPKSLTLPAPKPQELQQAPLGTAPPLAEGQPLPFADGAFVSTLPVAALCFVERWPQGIAEIVRVSRRRIVLRAAQPPQPALASQRSQRWTRRVRGLIRYSSR